jgi:chromosome partitioning protein
MAKIISFASQKGGVGKSTLLLMTAAAVHNRTNKRVLVIDCDPQKSIKDIYTQEDSEKSFDVVYFNWKQAKPEINFYKIIAMAEKKYDVIFLDIPGKLEGKEIYFSILVSDSIIVPIVASALDLNATIKFLKTLPKISSLKEEQGLSLDVYGLINKKDNTVEQQALRKLSGIGGLQLFYSPISNLVRYRRNISTWQDICDPEDSKDEFNKYFEEFQLKCLN